MTTDVDYADAQAYLSHFRHKGCDPDIVDNTEGLFNLFWYSLSVIDELKLELDRKRVNIARLREVLFGGGAVEPAEEDEDENEADSSDNPNAETSSSEPKPDKKDSNEDDKSKGHGRRGVDDYPGAEVVICQHELNPGEQCPQCHQGTLISIDPKRRIQFDGAAPLGASLYVLERLSCTHCDLVTTAPAPDGVDPSTKYTAKAKSTLAYFHYGMGVPYRRIAAMQNMFALPIAVSTQSELIAGMMGPVHGAFNHLIAYAAQSDLLYQDDTNVKILDLLKENKVANPARKGMYTSGFIAEGEHKVALYFSGRQHAGENFDSLLAHRDKDKGPPIRMADALSANSKHTATAIEAKCSSHAFRRFRSLLSTYPEQAAFVMHIYGQVYDHDDHCQTHQLDSQQRLAYHNEHSRPLMEQLKQWFERILDGEAEPNSPLAAECQYLAKHWEGLTRFLEIPGAPLDNNALEAMLKYMIMYRKNSQCFKTAYSAEYGSRLVSIIVTCLLNNVDAIDYLTQLQLHEREVWRDGEAWAPWNYRQTLQRISSARSSP